MERQLIKLPNQLLEVTAKQRAVDRPSLPQRRRRFCSETALSVAVVGGLAAGGAEELRRDDLVRGGQSEHVARVIHLLVGLLRLPRLCRAQSESI